MAAISILVIFGALGAWRGALATGLGLLTLGLSYAAAVLCAQHVGAAFGEQLRMPLVGPAAAGSVAFVLVMILGGCVSWAIKKLVDDDEGPGPNSRAFGFFFGGLRGLLIVFLLSWLAIWVDAGRQAGALETGMPAIEGSGMADFTSAVVEMAVVSSLGDGPGSAVVAKLASKPGVAVRSLQAVLGDPRIEALQRDRFFWTLIENKAVHRAMNRGSFRAISHDPQMRVRMAELGVIPPEAALGVQSFHDAMAPVLAEVGPRIKGLQDDPELRRLASDPEVVQLLESGDTLALVRHEGFQRLVSRVSKP